MTRIIAVVSGKGGVGKTTSAINITTALAKYGKKAVLVDGNLHNPNIGLYLGSPVLAVTLSNVLNGTHSVKEASYRHASGLIVVPNSLGHTECESDLKSALLDLHSLADFVVVDTQSGYSKNTHDVVTASDSVVAVTTPDIISLTDTLKMINFAESNGKFIEGIVVNRVNTKVNIANIEQFLGKKVIGIVPEHRKVVESISRKNPVVFSYPKSKPAVEFFNIAARLL